MTTVSPQQGQQATADEVVLPRGSATHGGAQRPHSHATRGIGRHRELLWHRVGVHAPLVLVLLLGAAVRLVNLNAVGFNSDEAVYAGQGASLAGNPHYLDYFPVFRAHPMLLQSLLAVLYRHGEHDLAARVVVVAFGVATLPLVHLIGSALYSRTTGLVAACLMAVMPYHVVVTRQVLLDGPMVFFTTLTLWCVAKFVTTRLMPWAVAAGAALGVAMLTKESAIVLAGAIYAFLALTPSVRRSVRASVAGGILVVALFALDPISVALSGHSSSTKAYFIWQLVREPNHTLWFYPATVPWAMGLLVVLSAGVCVWRARGGPAWREVLLASWFLVPALAFTVWPIKGYQYLLAGAPAVAVLAAQGLVATRWPLPSQVLGGRVRGQQAGLFAAVSVVVVSLMVVLVPYIGPSQGVSGLAGSGGIAGGREAGRWVGRHTPKGSELLTLGPSMANILEFYGNRRAFGLSVSPNPLKRNPSYVPLVNPDASLRHGDLQYIVWDAYSAERSLHFSEKLKEYVRRYHGRPVHTEYAERDGVPGLVIRIWEVRP